MPVLKSLSFAAIPKSGNDPVQMRRTKFIAKLEEQKQLLKDPNHVRTVQRWTKVNGERQATNKQQAVRPWWKADPSGQVVMSVKFGAKPIEFENGIAGRYLTKDRSPRAVIRNPGRSSSSFPTWTRSTLGTRRPSTSAHCPSQAVHERSRYDVHARNRLVRNWPTRVRDQ